MLEVLKLECERDYRLLFKDISFSLTAGEALRVSGPNGSGKTTLLRIICGLYHEYAGEVRWDGEALLYDMLYQGHASGVKDTLTSYENLKYLSLLSSDEEYPPEQFHQALKRVGLAGFADVFCGSLSAGQRKRVNLARFFLSHHRLWIMDEPFSAIDTQGVETLQNLMEAHLEKGGMLVITSHQPLQLSQTINQLDLGI